MNFSQLFGQLRSRFSQPEKLVNFWSTLVNHGSIISIRSNPSTVDQISKHDQRTIELTNPPYGGSQLSTFCGIVISSLPKQGYWLRKKMGESSRDDG